MSYFAEKLKLLRTQAGLSMQELADEAKVSKSMICKIERDEVQPTIDVAGRLAKALGKPLSEMLHATQSSLAVYLPVKDQPIWTDAQGVQRRNISPVLEGLKIEWLQVLLPPKMAIQKGAMMPGSGDKFILVTKGTLEIKMDEQVYKLKKGDSIYYNAASEHVISNTGKERTEFFVVIRHP